MGNLRDLLLAVRVPDGKEEKREQLFAKQGVTRVSGCLASSRVV